MDVVHDLDGGSALDAGTGLADSAPLPVSTAGGFGVSVDAYACETDSDATPPRLRLWFVSLLGSQQSVKALWALLVKGDTVALSDAGSTRFGALAHQAARGWRFFRASLPSTAGYHGLIVPETALYSTERLDFLLLPRHIDDAATLHHRFLTRRVSVPLHPRWADWLMARAIQTGEARALESRGLGAYRCVPDEAALTSDLSNAIRTGILGVSRDEAEPPTAGFDRPALVKESADGAS